MTTEVNAPVYKSTNGMAIASLVLSLVGISLPGAILGHVARNQIKKNPNQEGSGLALAGIIVGWIGTAFYTLIFTLIIVGAVVAGTSATTDFDKWTDCVANATSFDEMDACNNQYGDFNSN
jgi:hypothetical protein